jgi:hypothetical protein
MNKPLSELKRKFLLSIRDSKTVYPILINHNFKTIRELVEHSEKTLFHQ